jgi:hypothetical protein
LRPLRRVRLAAAFVRLAVPFSTAPPFAVQPIHCFPPVVWPLFGRRLRLVSRLAWPSFGPCLRLVSPLFSARLSAGLTNEKDHDLLMAFVAKSCIQK